jgi:hypothetical protein
MTVRSFLAFAVFSILATATLADERQVKMTYQVFSVPYWEPNVNNQINGKAASGWKLKSVSMIQCPFPDQKGRPHPCALIVMEKEDK